VGVGGCEERIEGVSGLVIIVEDVDVVGFAGPAASMGAVGLFDRQPVAHQPQLTPK
jgi:hypothetical protein